MKEHTVSKNIKLHLCALWMLSALFCTLVFTACKPDNKQIYAAQIVKEWMGKEILFPKDVPCFVFGKDTTSALCESLLDSEYKVLLYVDSAGCSDCRLRLFEWRVLMDEADSLSQGKLSFLFFFQPKESKSRNLEFMVRRNRFDYPVFIDVNNRLDSLNRFPKDAAFQCFLLGRKNNVLLIGNPLLNPRVWNLYKKQITGVKQEDSKSHTTVEPNKMVQDYSHVKKGSKNKVVFLIKNTGDQPLVLYRISVSCGCTQVEWDKQPIKSGKSAKVTVEMTPDETGFFNKTLEVYGNMEHSPLTLRIIGTAVD